MRLHKWSTTSATASSSASLLVLPLSRLELGDTWRILIEHLGFSGLGVRVERAVARNHPEARARSVASKWPGIAAMKASARRIVRQDVYKGRGCGR